MGNTLRCWPGCRYQRIDTEQVNHIQERHRQGSSHRNSAYDVDEETLKIPVSRSDLNLVARHIGFGFEVLGAELGHSLIIIEQIKAAHPFSLYMQILYMLAKWKEKNGRSATRLVLVIALWRCNGRCTIEWEEILNILQGPSTVSM